MARHPQGAAGTKTSAIDRGSGPYRPQTAGPMSRRRRVRDRMAGQRPPSTAEVARRLGTTPATLRRWIDRGLIPQYDGRVDAGRASPTPGSSRACASAATRSTRSATPSTSGRLAFGYLQELFPSLETSHTLDEAAARHGPGGRRSSRRSSRRWACPAGAVERISENDMELLRYGGGGARRGPAAGRVPAARPRLRPGARADRRRRGAPLPPVRPRAAHARRRPRRGDGRGDAGPGRARCCRSPRR